MGFLDKVKDFLDDGKINGSVGKKDEQQAAPQAAPANAAAAEKAPEPAATDEKRIMKDDIVELPLSFNGSGAPYQDADGNTVNVKMNGKVTAKALHDLADKELLEIALKSAPQMAYMNILMKDKVPAASLPAYSMSVSQEIAKILTGNAGGEFEIQSVQIVRIAG